MLTSKPPDPVFKVRPLDPVIVEVSIPPFAVNKPVDVTVLPNEAAPLADRAVVLTPPFAVSNPVLVTVLANVAAPLNEEVPVTERVPAVRAVIAIEDARSALVMSLIVIAGIEDVHSIFVDRS